jgi:hypothetical protein
VSVVIVVGGSNKEVERQSCREQGEATAARSIAVISYGVGKLENEMCACE